MSKFSTKKFTGTPYHSDKEVSAGSTQDTNVPFEKDNTDNKVFPEIQIKDISGLIDENTIGKMDADNMVYKAASAVETKHIDVKHKTEGVSVRLKGIREFKGQTKNISENSWLGVENEKRKAQKLPPWSVSDFEVTAGATLNKSYEESMERAKIQIYETLKNLRLQFGIPKIHLLLGEGDNFRHELPLCKPYKGNRTETLRPEILKDLRDWTIKELGAEEATVREDGQMVEADDLCEYYAAKGYASYRKTGIFSYVCISADKDSLGNPKLYVNPDRHTGKDNPLRGNLKYPQAMLIEATDRSCGGIDLIHNGGKKEIKGYGLKWVIYQSHLGIDSADHYSALKHLGRDFNYGEVSAYEDLISVNTPTEVIQRAVDKFAELLPYGVQYTTHDGVEMDVDCMEYMDTYFKVAYMLRSPKDTMDFYKLCEAFKVDISKVVGNNKLTAPVPVFVDNKEAEEKVALLKEMCDDVFSEIGSYKSLKKPDLVKRLDDVKNSMEQMYGQFEAFYELKQLEKGE